MGKSVFRHGDFSLGHCFNPRANNSASGNVFVNGKGVHRVGDGWPKHRCGDSVHASKTASGSGSVYVNGRPMARTGDALNCGDKCGPGSPNVFCGG